MKQVQLGTTSSIDPTSESYIFTCLRIFFHIKPHFQVYNWGTRPFAHRICSGEKKNTESKDKTFYPLISTIDRESTNTSYFIYDKY